METNIFVSAATAVGGGSREPTSKLNFLWFDRVIVEDLGKKDFGRKFIQTTSTDEKEKRYLSDVFVPMSDVDGGSIAKRRDEFHFEGYPRWEEGDQHRYDYPEPEEPRQFAHNALLAYFEKRAGVARFDDGYDIEQAEGAAKTAVDAVRVWALLNNRIPCTIACTPEERLAIDQMLHFASQSAPSIAPSDLVQNVASIVLPDVSVLTWSELIAIKKSGEFGGLREKIIDIYRSRHDYDDAAKAFAAEARQLGRKIVIKSKPTPIRALVDLVATNLPVGMFNPYSIFVGYKKFLSDCREASANQWVYTLAELEERVAKAAEVSKPT